MTEAAQKLYDLQMARALREVATDASLGDIGASLTQEALSLEVARQADRVLRKVRRQSINESQQG